MDDSKNEKRAHHQDPSPDAPIADLEDDLVQVADLPDLAAMLRAALDTSEDLRERARHSVDRRLQARSSLSALTSLGGTGVETLRHLLTNPAPIADRSHKKEV